VTSSAALVSIVMEMEWIQLPGGGVSHLRAIRRRGYKHNRKKLKGDEISQDQGPVLRRLLKTAEIN